MTVFHIILLGLLIVCAIAACTSKKLINSVVIFMSFSLVMCVIWFLLESPDLAITEAAVGAGVTSILFFLVLRKIDALNAYDADDEDESGRDAEDKVVESESEDHE
ncbi:MAG: DUF4040 domain-containing protein [Clostridium sp.]|nr:DUF4040 domain-containing protein [Clostridium sp.]MCM1399265.1 DUF4040 domain-containing protein [Clostridium sp.]MCM1459753.1 DUF4040 domain-containing protein [Bacteroides sp.]